MPTGYAVLSDSTHHFVASSLDVRRVKSYISADKANRDRFGLIDVRYIIEEEAN